MLREVDDTDEAFFSLALVATLDTERNLIRVRRSWWSEQSEWVKREVWKMEDKYLFASDFAHFVSLPPSSVMAA